MRRFWVDNNVGDESTITFEGGTLKHIRDVCRMGIGSKFEVLTDESKAYFVEMIEVTKKDATAKVIEVRGLPELPKPWVRLCVSIPKFATLESVMEKSVELGVKSIHPFFSDYSFVRTAEKITPNRTERWQRIVKGATQQTGRGDLMEIKPALNLSDLLQEFNQTSGAWGLFPYEGESAQSLSEAIMRLKTSTAEEIWCFVGSEGGFSTKEIELFQQFGLESTTLGEQILRVETACVALVGVIKYGADLWK